MTKKLLLGLGMAGLVATAVLYAGSPAHAADTCSGTNFFNSGTVSCFFGAGSVTLQHDSVDLTCYRARVTTSFSINKKVWLTPESGLGQFGLRSGTASPLYSYRQEFAYGLYPKARASYADGTGVCTAHHYD